ncbi:MAG: hypothetical protein ACE5GL_09990 [Calditrichia bacterium]
MAEEKKSSSAKKSNKEAESEKKPVTKTVAKDEPDKSKTESKEKSSTTSKTESKKGPADTNTGQEQPFQDDKSSAESLADKFSSVAEKVIEALKVSAEKVSDYAVETSHLARLKIEIANVRTEQKKVFTEMGEKLWKLHKSKKLDTIEEYFNANFDLIKKLESQIKAKEKEIQSLTKNS